MSMKVTTIDELKAMTAGEIVELPPFVKGQRFFVRMRRPSLLSLVKNGSIPNSLLHTANLLFTGKQQEENIELDDSFLSDMFDVIDVLAESSFVEPTFQEIRDAGIELTDQQYMAIFNYTQTGIIQLEPFREESEDRTIN